jgi:hypothetical protein
MVISGVLVGPQALISLLIFAIELVQRIVVVQLETLSCLSGFRLRIA